MAAPLTLSAPMYQRSPLLSTRWRAHEDKFNAQEAVYFSPAEGEGGRPE